VVGRVEAAALVAVVVESVTVTVGSHDKYE
jgi:hypothetical protein